MWAVEGAVLRVECPYDRVRVSVTRYFAVLVERRVVRVRDLGFR